MTANEIDKLEKEINKLHELLSHETDENIIEAICNALAGLERTYTRVMGY